MYCTVTPEVLEGSKATVHAQNKTGDLQNRKKSRKQTKQ